MPRSTRSERSPVTRRPLAAAVTLGPPVLFLVVFLGAPLVIVLTSAFFERGRLGGIKPEFTLDNFARLAEPVYFRVLVTSLLIAVAVTLVCLVIAYLVIAAMNRLSAQGRLIALVLILIPFWTSFLIRAYAWVMLLSDTGLVNGALLSFGLIETPLRMLYTPGAVVLVLVYVYLPLMILPLFASAQGVDPALRDAASNLGARGWRRFRTIDLPLTLPGALTGCAFVFVPAMSNFVVPDLIGGGKVMLVGSLIQDQFLVARDWPFGAVLALILLIALMGILIAQNLVVRRVNGGSQ